MNFAIDRSLFTIAEEGTENIDVLRYRKAMLEVELDDTKDRLRQNFREISLALESVYGTRDLTAYKASISHLKTVIRDLRAELDILEIRITALADL